MVKTGMTTYVRDHKDPTYDKALGNIRRENRDRLARMQRQVKQIVNQLGYDVESLVVKDKKSGAISKVG